MYSRILLNLFLVIFLVIFQVSFIGALPGIFSDLNLILVSLLYILGFSGLEYVFWWSVGTGVLLDFFSFVPFGSNMMSFIIVILLINFLLENFFTNRSLYSFLVLGFVAISLFEFFLYFFSGVISFLTRNDFNLVFDISFWRHEASIIFINLVFIFIFFYIYNMFGSKLKLSFLIKNN